MVKTERKGLPPIIRPLKLETDEYKQFSTTNKMTGEKQLQFTTMLTDLLSMPKRNKLIIELIKDLSKEKRHILVLTDRRSHVLTLKHLLDQDPSITFTYGIFIGAMKISELERSKECDVILATTKAFGEGVSKKELDTLILVTPKKFIGHLKNATKNESGKLEQIMGRIFRKTHTECNPLIIDFQDHFSIYKSQSAGRNVFYKQHFSSAIFEDQSIHLDEYTIHEISPQCIKTKKKKLIEKDQIEQDKIENINHMMNYCMIMDE